MADEQKVTEHKDDNVLDDLIEIKENGESVGHDLVIVAMVRHLMRPFLTVFFSMMYGAVIIFGAYLSVIGKLEWKDVLIATEAITLPVIGYHFGKPSNVDKK